MKEITTNNFKKKADMITHPPVFEEEDGSKTPARKGWKYLPQLNKWVREVDIDIEV